MNTNTSFSCHGFNEALPSGRASGELSLGATGFDFNIKGMRGHIPYEGAELKLGGASDRLIFIHHPSLRDWSIYTSDKNLLNHEQIKNHPALTQHVRNAKNKRLKNHSILALISLTIIALPLLVLLNMGWFTQLAAQQIPVTWEEQIGKSAMGQFQMNKIFMAEEQVDHLLEPLVHPLEEAQSNNKYQYRYHIVSEPSPNAFALPGGYIVIHSGLILKADSAEELLGVLAHEMAHVTEQHGIRNMIGSAGIYLMASIFIGDANGVIATLAAAAPFLINQSYSRKYEREADKLGHQTLLGANVNPAGLAGFFEKLIAEEEKMLSKIESEKQRELVKDALGFLSTHPASEERIQYLHSLPVNTTKPFLDLTNEFESLKLAVQDFVADQSPRSSEESIEYEGRN